MLAIDTNILIRYITKDVPELAERARRFLMDCSERGEPVFIADSVLCEITWGLQSGYRSSRETINDELRKLFNSKETRFSSESRIRAAIEAYANGRSGFPDYLIREEALEQGCRAVSYWIVIGVYFLTGGRIISTQKMTAVGDINVR